MSVLCVRLCQMYVCIMLRVCQVYVCVSDIRLCLCKYVSCRAMCVSDVNMCQLYMCVSKFLFVLAFRNHNIVNDITCKVCQLLV